MVEIIEALNKSSTNSKILYVVAAVLVLAIIVDGIKSIVESATSKKSKE
jgi:hypothetical protein